MLFLCQLLLNFQGVHQIIYVRSLRDLSFTNRQQIICILVKQHIFGTITLWYKRNKPCKIKGYKKIITDAFI